MEQRGWTLGGGKGLRREFGFRGVEVGWRKMFEPWRWQEVEGLDPGGGSGLRRDFGPQRVG